MRGFDSKTEALFTYVTPESFVPKDHPLRAIRKMVDTALAGMDKLLTACSHYRQIIDPAGEAAEGPIADDPLLHPQ